MAQHVLMRTCQIAIIAVPTVAAQNVAEQLLVTGIKGILCYAPIHLIVPPTIRIEYIDPVIHLQQMTYYTAEDMP